MTEQTALVAPGTTPGAATPYRVLGLDLSLTSTGVAYPDGRTARIRTNIKDGDRRLNIIRREIEAAIGAYWPHLAVLEDLPVHAKSAGITGMVHGVARAALADAKVPVALIAPATLKAYAVDNGAASKADMVLAAEAAARHVIAYHDEADAWWLRAAGLQHLGYPVVDVTDKQAARLAKAKWPTHTTEVTP
ncbi:MAG TPA: hypothetical protein VFH77_16315 [Streptomyces sp.]|nr:hypothetical protein [Streptomyces sp.]